MFKMIMTSIESFHRLLNILENSRLYSKLALDSSCRKSPANTIDTPPNGFALSLVSFSHWSSFFSSSSHMNKILSMINIFTSCHSLLSSSVSAPFFIKYDASHIIKPSTSVAADPVYAVNKNAWSLQSAPIRRSSDLESNEPRERFMGF